MAIKKIVGPIGGQAPTSTSDYIAQNNILTALMIGLGKVPFTEYATTVQPQIAEGVPIQFGGALYHVPIGDGPEDIGGSMPDGEVYVKLVPNVDASELSATFTDTWDAIYNFQYGGWYNPSGHMFLPYGMTKAGVLYSDKFQYYLPGNRVHKVYYNGTVIADKIGALILV